MKPILGILLLFIFFGCRSGREPSGKLPVLGQYIDGHGDTVLPVITDFSFLNQDSVRITNATFSGKIYIADFIFLSCPTICPKMNQNMLKVYSAFNTNDTVLFLSHTIDPSHDSIPLLRRYAQNIGVTSYKWHFVTGNADSIYHLAEKVYFSTAYKDSAAPGGYVHSGGFLLIDGERHIRGVYDGTSDTETERLMADIRVLLREHDRAIKKEE
ncbi:MAG: SCO family protein [Sediminibacterium sp.]|nr:SCO family protein [Sediminibacterium sp.]